MPSMHSEDVEEQLSVCDRTLVSCQGAQLTKDTCGILLVLWMSRDQQTPLWLQGTTVISAYVEQHAQHKSLRNTNSS